MNKIITKIEREKGYVYKVDKDGNIIKSNYNIFKDPYTIVTILIIILGSTFYIQMKDSRANIDNLDNTCEIYLKFKERWIQENPGQIPAPRQILKAAIDNQWKIDTYFIEDG